MSTCAIQRHNNYLFIYCSSAQHLSQNRSILPPHSGRSPSKYFHVGLMGCEERGAGPPAQLLYLFLSGSNQGWSRRLMTTTCGTTTATKPCIAPTSPKFTLFFQKNVPRCFFEMFCPWNVVGSRNGHNSIQRDSCLGSWPLHKTFHALGFESAGVQHLPCSGSP